MYQTLEQGGADQRVEADMQRAKEAIDRADSAAAARLNQEYVDGLAHIALRLTQTAEAKNAALAARAKADSLKFARLQRLLRLSAAQRDSLAAAKQLSDEELVALRERGAIAAERADSLARQVDSLAQVARGGEVETDSLRLEMRQQQARIDSLLRIAQADSERVDSLRSSAQQASREQTTAEQAEIDSLRQAAQAATHEADSLRGSAAATAANAKGQPDSLQTRVAQAPPPAVSADTQRADSLHHVAESATREADSLRAVSEASSRERDSLRAAAEAASRSSDSLRAEVEAAKRLNAALVELRGSGGTIRTLRQTSRGLVVSLSDVLFDVGKANLQPGGARNLGRIAQVLQQYPNYKISVEGHTDSRGSAQLNERLSEQRAEAVKQALVSGGLDASRIAAQGFGATQPVATNATRAGRQLNRRVEIVVLGAGGDTEAH
jgi:outer membrane protein OmpA-like peptidoglycan-associated protein